MSQRGQVARRPDAPAPAEPGAAELLDPVALEARLVEARARRAEVMARRAAGETMPPAPTRPLHARRNAAATPRLTVPGGAEAHTARIATVLPTPEPVAPMQAEPDPRPAAVAAMRFRFATPVALLLGVAAGAVGTAVALGVFAPSFWAPANSPHPQIATVGAASPEPALLPGSPLEIAAAQNVAPWHPADPALGPAPAPEASPAPGQAGPDMATALAALASAPEVLAAASPFAPAPLPVTSDMPASPEVAEAPALRRTNVTLGPSPAAESPPGSQPVGQEVASLVAALSEAPAAGTAEARPPAPASLPPAASATALHGVAPHALLALAGPVAGETPTGLPEREPIPMAELAALLSPVPGVDVLAPSLAAPPAAGADAPWALAAAGFDFPTPAPLAPGPADEPNPAIPDGQRHLWLLTRFAADLPTVGRASAPTVVSWAPAGPGEIGYDVAPPAPEPVATATLKPAAPRPARAAAAPKVASGGSPRPSAQAKLVERAVLENTVENMLRNHLRSR